MSKQSAPNSEAKSEIFDPEGLVGQRITGRYLVERCIGRGGMGVVYMASQSALNRKVVIKVLRSTLVEDDEAIARFEREAQGLSALQHPNIVTIYDFGHDEGRAYIVMEFVEGETISRFIRREGPMKMPQFLQIAAQILQGIGEAHTLGLLHRDIKPANIMLSERHGHTNFVKILDFGLAKLASGATEVTKEQSLVGSAAFLSPEQIVGLDEIDQRVDVYALGVLFYYMVSGKRPFSADNDAALLYKHVHEAPTPLQSVLPEGSDLTPAAINLIHQSLAKNPNKRPNDANEMLDILTGQVAGQSPSVLMPWSNMSLHGSNPSGQPAQPRGYQDSDSFSSPSSLIINTSSGAQSVSLVRAADGSLQVIPVDGGSGSYSRDHPFMGGRRRSPLVPVLLTLILVGGGAGLYFGVIKKDEPTAAPAAPATSAASVNPAPSAPLGETPEQARARLQTALDKVKAYIDEEEFSRAESALALIDASELATHGLDSLALDHKEQIKIGLLMIRAENAAADDNLSKALELYGEVLTIDRDHEKALARRAELKEKMSAAARVPLIIEMADHQIKGSVTIEGQELGDDNTTPLMRELAVGKYTITVEASGYETWTRDILLTEGEQEKVVVAMERRVVHRPTVRRPPRNPTPDPTPTNNATAGNDTSTQGGGEEPTPPTTRPGRAGTLLDSGSGGDGLLLPSDGSGGGLLPSN